MVEYCSATNKLGTQCRWPIWQRSSTGKTCFIHDPNASALRAEARKRGVEARHQIASTGLTHREAKMAMVEKRYLSREELLVMLSARIRIFIAKYGSVIEIPEGATPLQIVQLVEGVAKVEHVICSLAKAMAQVMGIELAEGVKIKGWMPKPIYETIDAPKSSVG